MGSVALETGPSYIPLALVFTHAIVVSLLSLVVGLDLYHSYKALGPALGLARGTYCHAFTILAAVSFVSAFYWHVRYLTVSFDVWALERGIGVSASVGALFSEFLNDGCFHLARWLNDKPVYTDAFEIVAEETKRVWWAQQVDIATVSWMILLSVKRRHRHIPYLWAYALLAQLFSLSFAQNLFYVALLLKPSAAPLQKSRLSTLFDKVFPPKPANWVMKPNLYLAVLLLNYVAIMLIPDTAGTKWFPAVIGLAKGLQFAPLLLPTIVPTSWGVASREPRGSCEIIAGIFKMMSLTSEFARFYSTIKAISHSPPEHWIHRHSIGIPFDTEKRLAWERTALWVDKIFEVVTDHPVLTGIGCDIALSGLSLAIWAAARVTDLVAIGSLANPSKWTWLQQQSTPSTEALSDIDKEPDSIARLRQVAFEEKKLPWLKYKAFIEDYSGLSDDEISTPTPATRRYGQPIKIKVVVKPDAEEAPGEKIYELAPVVSAGAADYVVPYSDYNGPLVAMVLCLTILGGIGLGSSVVFGTESVLR
ncbi:hypothetical protein OQA88_486 [Cercophora sp. LCS_1]